MTDDMIKQMAERFLSWKLPAEFSPDAGISFKPEYGVGEAHAGRHEPTGTNLFTATQAQAMVRYMMEGLLRPEVAAFALHMEAALKRKDSERGGNSWQLHTLPEEILPHLQERVERIAGHLQTAETCRKVGEDMIEQMQWDSAAEEAVHAANFAMMIADICDPLTRREASAKVST